MSAPASSSSANDGRRRVLGLVVCFVLVVAGLGALIGLVAGLLVVGIVVAAVVAVVNVLIAYLRGGGVVLRVSRAVPADHDRYQRFHNLVEGLCLANGLTKPSLYVIHDPAPNALSVGRDPRHASIAVTTGLLDSMNRVELEGVMAHELARVRSGDLAASTLVVTTVGLIPLLSDLCLRLREWNGGREAREGDRPHRSNPLGVLGLVLAPVSFAVAPLVRSLTAPRPGVSNDVAACQLTRYPPGLLSALERMSLDRTVTHSACGATAHLWLAEPLAGVGDSGRHGGLHRPFSTHRPIADRIALLREL